MTKTIPAETMAQAKRLMAEGYAPVIGRLWYSKRRFSYAIRFNDTEAHTLEDGARWEPVVIVKEAA